MSEFLSPLIILSPGRTFSTVVTAMLGRHPLLYALPETCLLARDSMADYIRDLDAGLFDGGLIHAVHQIVFAADSNSTPQSAVEWLRARREQSTLSIFDELRGRVAPRCVVEKSPVMTSSLSHLTRLDAMFGENVRYLHLTRHPLSYGTSLLDTLKAVVDNVSPEVAMTSLRQPESLYFGALESATGIIDPQFSWLRRHSNIDSFLSRVPAERQLRIRGEDFVNDASETVKRVSAWLQLYSDASSIDAMLHPERWEFVNPHASGNKNVGDRKFFANPGLRSRRTVRDSLHCALRWRRDGGGFTEEVKSLAQSYGYR